MFVVIAYVAAITFVIVAMNIYIVQNIVSRCDVISEPVGIQRAGFGNGIYGVEIILTSQNGKALRIVEIHDIYQSIRQ